MNFLLFAANVKMGTPAPVLYQFLDEKSKKEFFDSLKNCDSNVLRTLDSYFLKEDSDFLTMCLKDYASTLDYSNSKEIMSIVTDFLVEVYLSHTFSPSQKGEVIKSFINSGLNVNEEEEDTPLLHYVAVYCNQETIQFMVEKGAKINLIDLDDDTALSSSIAQQENVENFSYLISLENINYTEGKNVLAIALRRNYEKIIDIIIEKKLLDNDEFFNQAQNQIRLDQFEEFLIKKEKFDLENTLTLSLDKKARLKI